MTRKPDGHVYQVTVRGKVLWQADRFHEIDGKQVRITGRAADPGTAWRRLEKNYLKRLVKYGEAPPSALRNTGRAESLTVEQWFERWFEMTKTMQVSPNTRFRQRGLMKNHIFPHIGQRKIRNVTSEQIEELLYVTLPKLKNPDGTRRLGANPIRGVYYILNPAFAQALKKGYVGFNPVEEIAVPPKDRPKDDQIEDKLWIPERLRRRTHSRERAAYWILASYGLRQSERLGLCWEQFRNLDSSDGSAVLVIDRQLYNNAEAGRLEIRMEPKSKAGIRAIPLTESVRSDFLKHKNRQRHLRQNPDFLPSAEFEDLCFLDNRGRPIRHSDDNDAWKLLLKECGIPHLRQHGMRHICATLLAVHGTPAEVAMSILGHGSTAMTSYYTHIGTRAKQPALKALEDVMIAPSERSRRETRAEESSN